MENKYELYKLLASSNGISGHEKSIKKLVKKELLSSTNEILEDKLGSVFGVDGDKGPTIMICAHMDEVGFMVRSITKGGKIKLLPIGGTNPEVYLSQNMNIIISDELQIKGIIASIPPHLAKDMPKKALDADDLILDVGFDSYDEAYSSGIRVGQQVVSDNDFYFSCNNKRIVSKAIDDRFGLAMCLEIFKEACKNEHPNRLVCGGTVQEEVGLRGAITATNLIKPDLFITIDVSPVNDFLEKDDSNAFLGKGFLVRYYDPRIIMNRELHDYITTIAKENNISYQEYKANGGTDAANAQYASSGTLATTIGLSGRYIHTNSAMCDVDDIESIKKIVSLIIKNFDNDALEKIKNK